VRPLRKFIPKRVRHFFLGWAARIGFALGRMLPRRAGLVFFSCLGALCYYLLSRDRKRTLDNLRFVFGGEWSEKKIRATAKAVFMSLGKNLFDAIKLDTLSAEKFDETITHDSLDSMESAKRGGKGGVLITAHVGCFEMLLHFFSRKGFGGIVVGREFKNPMVDEVVRRMRSGPGIVYMDKSENSRKVVRMLQEGRFMGVLVDQDTKVEGVFADFLGHQAFTPSGAVRFAMKFGIPIIVSVAARLPGDKHHVFVSPALENIDTGDFEADLATNVQRVNDIICGYIRKYPEQWVWMHERWKTKPPQEMVDKGVIDKDTASKNAINKDVVDKEVIDKEEIDK
jgi:KDO2-lipid IV(A) lauroyltransferase